MYRMDELIAGGRKRFCTGRCRPDHGECHPLAADQNRGHHHVSAGNPLLFDGDVHYSEFHLSERENPAAYGNAAGTGRSDAPEKSKGRADLLPQTPLHVHQYVRSWLGAMH